jgi:addiction module HigA family antidote
MKWRQIAEAEVESTIADPDMQQNSIKGRKKNLMRAIHPGEILREEFLAPLKMSAHALSLELKVAAPRINDIVRERRAVSADTALRLARYFGTTPDFWLNLQSAYELKIAQKELGRAIEAEVRERRSAA